MPVGLQLCNTVESLGLAKQESLSDLGQEIPPRDDQAPNRSARFYQVHRRLPDCSRRRYVAGSNGLLSDYFRDISGAATNEYRPEDAYVGNLIGALRAIDAGITTITDLSQVSNPCAPR